MSVLGLDIGTSSVKALLVGPDRRMVAEASAPLDISRPHPLWSEQDPQDWWSAVEACVGALRRDAPAAWATLDAIGLSGQQHGAVLIGAGDRVLRPAILWNDGRSGAQCAELHRRMPDLAARASSDAMPGFTGPKLVWIAEHEPETFAAVEKVLLPKDYVRLRMTGGYVSDMSDASGTLWLDIANRRWDDALLAVGGMRRAQMPDLVEGSDVSGVLRADVAAAWGLAGRRVVVAGGAGDNCAAACGIGATAPGAGFLSLGTSGVLFCATDGLRPAPERMLHAFCHALPGRWHVMAVMLSAASALSWIAETLGRARDLPALLAEVEAFAATPGARADAPVFIPYLTGERTPWNDPAASGQFSGLRAQHGAAAMTYAVLEGVGFAFALGREVVGDAGVRIDRCAVVGGGARSDFWCAMLADMTGLTLDRSDDAQAGGALGAARLAMLAAGFGTEAEVCAPTPVSRRFTPDETRRAGHLARRPRFDALIAADRALRGLAPGGLTASSRGGA